MPNQPANILNQPAYLRLLGDLENFIKDSKVKVEEFAKNQLVQAYWQVGKRIEEENLSSNSNYHFSVIQDLAKDLAIDEATLQRCVKLFKTYPNSAPSPTFLSWSHYKYLLAVNDDSARQDLEQKAVDEKWTIPKLGSEVKNLKSETKINLQAKISRPTKANYLYKAKIINVVDGDTLLLNIDLGFSVIKEQRVRLSQIDAAEKETEDGQRAFKYLRDLAATIDFVVVRTNKIDIYGRYLGDIFYPKVSDGSNVSNEKIEIFEKGVYLNEKLVDEGLVSVF